MARAVSAITAPAAFADSCNFSGALALEILDQSDNRAKSHGAQDSVVESKSPMVSVNEGRYWHRSDTIGSRWAALTAGAVHARRLVAARMRTVNKYVVGSSGAISNRKDCSRVLATNAATSPTAAPTKTRRNPSRTIARNTRCRDAPRARRIPISPERWTTEYVKIP